MAATVAASARSSNTTAKNNGSRLRETFGRRRRIEDEEGCDDDSLTDRSPVSDEEDTANDSDTSNIDEASPKGPAGRKGSTRKERGAENDAAAHPGVEESPPSEATPAPTLPPSSPPKSAASAAPAFARHSQPPVVSSSSVQAPRRETAYEKQRREHDLYRQKRDEDPSFVPNRGAFFMHDHRGAGPAANGFRPFGRPGRGSRGRGGGFAGSFSPFHGPFAADPSVSGPWAHDMHEVVTQLHPPRLFPSRRPDYDTRSQYGGSHAASIRSITIPTCPPSTVPIMRSMSVEKALGTVTLRLFIPPMKEPVLFEKFKMVQYTKLPDHRPPLRRDKAVVINLPGHPKHQIFPAVDRSFIFIPRALRPNQQRGRGNRTHSTMGSASGFSRHTSVLGAGSYCNGSMYSPSVALSRCSSIARDAGRDFLISPTGSAVSRPPLAIDNTAWPVVRLPQTSNPSGLPAMPGGMMVAAPSAPVPGPAGAPLYMGGVPHPMPSFAPPPSFVPGPTLQHRQPPPHVYHSVPPAPSSQPPVASSSQSHKPHTTTSSLSSVPPPQHHPLPQKPTFQETRPSHNSPMHEPRPQKAVSADNTEAPSVNTAGQTPSHQQPSSTAFHQQVPTHLANGFPSSEFHTRNLSYQSHSTGTPLSQIPERAIHAAPFQPNQPGQMPVFAHANMPSAPGPTYYSAPAGLSMVHHSSQQGYPYQTSPPAYTGGMVPSLPAGYVPGGTPHGAISTPVGSQQSMVAQEVNGMVYYLDPSQMSNVPGFSTYATAPPQGGYMSPMGSMVASAPAEGYYYGPHGVMYYSQ